MAKVYEALQKAEEERRRRSSPPGAPVPPPQTDSFSSERTDRGARKPAFWRRWANRLLRGRASHQEDAADLNRRRVSLLQPESYVAEQFRTLRGRIDALAAQRPVRTVAMTSARPGDGKSTAALNLAVVTAMGVGREVALVDCDLRRPQMHRSLGVEARAGLAEVLLDEASLDDALVKVEGLNLQVLPVRAQPPNPSELLASSKMIELIEELSRRFDRVVLDTPATLGLPDAKTVSDLCDGLVLVVRADVTPREEIEAALDVLDRRRLLGVVLNGASSSAASYGYS